jgi:hypothetical protein
MTPVQQSQPAEQATPQPQQVAKQPPPVREAPQSNQQRTRTARQPQSTVNQPQQPTPQRPAPTNQRPAAAKPRGNASTFQSMFPNLSAGMTAVEEQLQKIKRDREAAGDTPGEQPKPPQRSARSF